MKKDGLVEAVMKAAELQTKKQAEMAVDTVFATIAKSLGRGEEVGVAGFGIFKVAHRKERMGINPKTQEKIRIPAAKKPKFQAAKALKDTVN